MLQNVSPILRTRQSSIDFRKTVEEVEILIQEIHTDTLNWDECTTTRLKLHDINDHNNRRWSQPTTLTIDAFDLVRRDELVSCSPLVNPDFQKAWAAYKIKRYNDFVRCQYWD